ncbi:mitochondrial potassium channel [Anguilla anguilla]|uniref:mitochondrial potassium channel n=1 Tax=Anguilla anguilla TaxID=7936 RepID=UPI0015AF8AE9|nr:mitochondrial potassium channel [Anguilla anguilla]XP_035245048.1 mitochondrial potassium channel [Anguilla anguilla]
MRYRGGLILSRSYGTSSYLGRLPGKVKGEIFASRGYCTPHQSPKDEITKTGAAQHRAVAALQNFTELGRQWGQNLARTASATGNYWWVKYEEFVGLNEVKDAQMNVTEAEKAFMVARGMVREAHVGVEALQGRLKEVRDRLDRVSREEAHYLELATLEHKLLQEERRLRTAYENAEGAERERFSLFSAAVRESHEKERTRAERTKNWSVIGSVLGALIGVMGSTYVNRVRLLELRGLLLEAQKGPVSLQEAIRVQAGMHKAQQEELRGLIDSLSGVLRDKRTEEEDRTAPGPALAPSPTLTPQSPSPSAFESALKVLLLSTQKAQTLMEGLQPQLRHLEESVGKMESELQAVRASIETHYGADKVVVSAPDTPVLVCETEDVMHGLAQTEKRLGNQINKTTLYNTVLTYTAFAVTLPLLYIIFRGS